MKVAQEKKKKLSGDLDKMGKERSEASEKLTNLEESLQIEKAISESLRAETDRLKRR